jgi:quercetin dioxygenase-like cupin family protein
MYKRTNLEDLEARDVDGVESGLLAVGYELRPEKMRPSAWVFEAGESNNRHRQREQEELYLVLDGRFAVEVDGEEFGVGAGEVVIVPPESWRQFTALEAGTLFVVGAPNTKEDAIQEGDEGL